MDGGAGRSMGTRVQSLTAKRLLVVVSLFTAGAVLAYIAEASFSPPARLTKSPNGGDSVPKSSSCYYSPPETRLDAPIRSCWSRIRSSRVARVFRRASLPSAAVPALTAAAPHPARCPPSQMCSSSTAGGTTSSRWTCSRRSSWTRRRTCLTS